MATIDSQGVNLQATSIAITGATGLVGTALTRHLTDAACRVSPARRIVGELSTSGDETAGDQLNWSPHEVVDFQSWDGIDAVVHLAGENIAGRRWNNRIKSEIRNSRVTGTQMLAESLAEMSSPPKTLVCASAIGYYGNRGNEILTEKAPRGTGFLADVAADWEAATQAASDAGIRVVHLRLGVVISRDGGALAQMLTPFRMGVGGRIGSGEQYWSWISLHDVCRAIFHVLQNEQIEGPVNGVSPEPTTNLEFTKTLGKALRRPTFLPMPAFAAKLALGGMAEELLLSSLRVVPEKLLGSGFDFTYPTLYEAICDELLGDSSHAAVSEKEIAS